MHSFERWTKSLPIGHSVARDCGPLKSTAGSATDSDAITYELSPNFHIVTVQRRGYQH